MIVRRVAGVGSVRDIALSPDGRYAYVVELSSDAIKVVDTTADAVIGTIDAPVGVSPISLAASGDAPQLYVADRGAAAIHIVDVSDDGPTRGQIVDSLFLAGTCDGTPTTIALSPNGSRLYARTTNPAVLVIDVDTGLPVNIVAGGHSVGMFAAGERIYVCADDRLGLSTAPAAIVTLEADTGQQLGSFRLDEAPGFIRQPILAAGTAHLYLDIDDLDGLVEVVDMSTLNVVAHIRIDAAVGELCSIPAAAALSLDGRSLYVANQGLRLLSEDATEVGWVSVVDTHRNEVVAEIPLPAAHANPQFVAVSPAGDRLVVVNEYGLASIINIEANSVACTVTLGKPADQSRVVLVNPARNVVYVGGDAGLTVIPL